MTSTIMLGLGKKTIIIKIKTNSVLRSSLRNRPAEITVSFHRSVRYSVRTWASGLVVAHPASMRKERGRAGGKKRVVEEEQAQEEAEEEEEEPQRPAATARSVGLRCLPPPTREAAPVLSHLRDHVGQHLKKGRDDRNDAI